MVTHPLELRSVPEPSEDGVAAMCAELTVAHGEVLGIVAGGADSAHARAIVRAACGFSRPAVGQVRVVGFDIAEDPTRAKWHLGYLPDAADVPARLTGREYLAFVGELYGMDRTDRDARIAELLARYGVASREADALLGSVALGTRRRIALIAGMLHRPTLVVAEEPLDGLHAEGVRVTMALLREHAARGGGALVVLRSAAMAEALCTRVLVLRDGVLMEGAAPAAGAGVTPSAEGAAPAWEAPAAQVSGRSPRWRGFPTRAFRRGHAFLFQKELLVLSRSPGELARAALLAALVVPCILALRSAVPSVAAAGPIGAAVLAGGGMAAFGVITTLLAMRFAHPAVSSERRAAQALFVSPVHDHEFSSWKFFFWTACALPFAAASALLLIAALGVAFPVSALFAFSACCAAVTITAMAVGQGSMHPRFDDPRPLHLAATRSGIAATVLCLGYTAVLARYAYGAAFAYASTGNMSTLPFFGVLISSLALVGTYAVAAPDAMERIEAPE